MAKVRVERPLVEMEGDEMAQVMWAWVRDRLVLPFVDVGLVRFDLSIGHRARTDDRVTLDAASVARRHGVSLKCSTITPDRTRQRELGLARALPSPNGTLRAALDGVIFREPVICRNVARLVPHWAQPVVIARHAFGEQYRAQELAVPGPGTVRLVFDGADGSESRELYRFDGPGVALALFNIDASIRGFARACFHYGLQRRMPVYFSHKATVLKQYDGRFVDLFAEEFEAFAPAFAEAGLVYAPRLIDDMAAFSVKSAGGYLWACKNYDGDVQADYMAQGYGSPGLMTSVLMSPDGRLVQTETAHGTVRRHYDRWRAGAPVLANPLATIHAWSRALWHRARLDGTPDVAHFAETLERAAADLVDEGVLTPDLAPLAATRRAPVDTAGFIDAVAARLAGALR